MAARFATHAGSWYTEDEPILNGELDAWLAEVPGAPDGPPFKGCKAIIAPHAGYSYSGPTAAWAYKSIDTTGIKRVFILGPSHHVYLEGCAITSCSKYSTPLGDLPIDEDTNSELQKTGNFDLMSLSTDQDEHSIELHLPYVRKIFDGVDIKIVPILVGSLKLQQERRFGEILAPYLASPDTLFVISSDFCHWSVFPLGSRFSYTFYYPTPLPCSNPTRLTRNSNTTSLIQRPIHQSITDLDHEAMDILALDPSSASTRDAHAAFAAYLARTKNTICGRHPIGVLLGALTAIERGLDADQGGKKVTLRWVRYAQSSPCVDVRDSSVSYASAYVVF
ncbi:hypothetical protein BS47DRAFT_1371987 [Hydnum rufescens UP504]|uniref:Uncharacterized protein n=1 Tax=Hydnum rufescens UP504 TaxID=1448309 RepID=A0A9P6B151_9AGAM|nr:hypothetical protein BS47DRAFT_1371987 [Hydnum rufescens UP504]